MRGDAKLDSGLTDSSINSMADLTTRISPDPTEPDLLGAHSGSPFATGDLRNGAASRSLVVATAILLLGSAVFFALHFVHLSADFPNHSPWMDWSKYTDEGWYGDGAIRQIQLGHWYVRGDFNPAVALPVWPGLEFLLFKVTGVSLVAARALSVSVFGGILVASYLLLRRLGKGTSLAAATAVALLAVSPFCFAFTRLAILEPLLVLLTLLAILATAGARSRPVFSVLALGLLLPLMILTKTTAVFLLPSVAWMLWASAGYRFRRFLRVGVPAAALAGASWSMYFFLLVRPRFLEDYRYLFSANAYTGMTRENAWSVVQGTVRDGVWMGGISYPLAMAAVILAVIFWRRSFGNPLVPSLMLWAAGYAAFLAYHNNLQPRYYLVVAVPLTLLVPIVFEQVYIAASAKFSRLSARITLGLIVAAAFLAIMVTDARKTIEFLSSPQYEFTQAAADLSRVVRASRDHNPLILSISGSDISLMTGLPSICDDFGTMALEDRIALYRPGWYATWNQVDDDKMDALSPLFHLQRVASFMAFDDPDRNLLILYRLDPPAPEEPRKKKRKAIPKQLQTKIGQQPSASQLEH